MNVMYSSHHISICEEVCKVLNAKSETLLIFEIDRLFRMVHKKETWKITLVLVTSIFNSGEQNVG